VSPSAPVARLQDAQRTLLSVVVASALAVACIAVLPTAALASPPSVPVVTAPLDEGSFAVGAIVPFGATADTGSVLECKLDSGSWGSCPVNYTPGDGSKIAVGWRTRLVFGQELGTSRVDVGQLHYGSHSSYLNGQDAGTRFADAMWWDSDQSNCSSFPYGNEYGGAYGVVLTADGTPTSLTNEFGLDCSITSKYSTGDLLQELAAGDHTLAVRATNGTGTSDPANVTFTIVDTTAPDAPVLSGAPSGTVNAVTASIGFTGEADATFSCKLDSGSYAACGSSPKALTALGAGSHTFYVTQTDLAGNESIAASANWTVQAIGTTSPTLQSGSDGVAKPNVIKGEGYGLTGLIGTEPTPVFQWQRCTTLNDAASCAALTGVAGSTGAWWGTRDADIGYQMRLSVGWSTVQGVKSALSALSGLVAPSVTAAPAITFGTNPYSRRLDPSPVKDVKQHTSFGTWAGYIAGVSTVSFEWQTCTDGADTSTCSASATGINNQWYTPTANDVGKYLRTKATITTRGQTAIGYSATSYIRATRPLCRQATATRTAKAHAAGARHGKAHTAARIRAHAAC